MIFWYTFLILTVMHPIADFYFGSNRRLHYFVALNPLHWLWDISPFRQHARYSKVVRFYSVIDKGKQLDLYKAVDEIENKLFDMQVITSSRFWKWLAQDQLAHVFLNLLFAGFLEWLI